MSIEVGIVGYGNIGQLHHRVIDACDGARVSAVVHRGFPLGDAGVRTYPSLRELLANSRVDVVVICTPSGLHAEQALAALRAGRHVVVEKPLTLHARLGKAVVDEARRRGLLLSVIAQRRFAPHNQLLKQALHDGRLGRPVLGESLQRWRRGNDYYAAKAWRGTWAMDGGVLMNQAIHAIDLLRWMLGPVEEAHGVCATTTHDIEVEDSAVATLRFTSGALGVISATTSAPRGMAAELNLIGERGVVALHEQGVVRWEVPHLLPPKDDVDTGSGADQPMNISDRGHRRQWSDILAALNERRDPAVTGEEGLLSAALVLAIYRSWRQGRPVRPNFQHLDAIPLTRFDRGNDS